MVNYRILVTGGTGFIGSHLIPRLREQGHDVYCLTRYVVGRNFLYPNNGVKTITADITDIFAIQNIIKILQPEIIIHLAALSPVAYSYDRPLDVVRVNYLASVNLAETAMRYDTNLRQFIAASSSEVYGLQDTFPISEDAPLLPNSPYSASKIAMDQYLQFMFEAYHFPAVRMRPFNTYGRVLNQHFVVERCITQMLRNEPVFLGDPNPIRDFLYIDDHVRAYLSVLGREETFGQAINFCTGREVTIQELVDMIAKQIGYQGNVVWNTVPPRPLDIMRLVGDNGKAWRLVNWKPSVWLEDGLALTIRELRKQVT